MVRHRCAPCPAARGADPFLCAVTYKLTPSMEFQQYILQYHNKLSYINVLIGIAVTKGHLWFLKIKWIQAAAPPSGGAGLRRPLFFRNLLQHAESPTLFCFYPKQFTHWITAVCILCSCLIFLPKGNTPELACLPEHKQRRNLGPVAPECTVFKRGDLNHMWRDGTAELLG